MNLPRLIPSWRQSWRFFSMQIAAAAVVFGTLAPDTQAAMLGAIGVAPTRVPALIGLLVLVGRLISQQPRGAS